MATKVAITYRTTTGHVFTDNMDSVENFRRFRGDEDEILSVGEPFEWAPPAPAEVAERRRRTETAWHAWANRFPRY